MAGGIASPQALYDQFFAKSGNAKNAAMQVQNLTGMPFTPPGGGGAPGGAIGGQTPGGGVDWMGQPIPVSRTTQPAAGGGAGAGAAAGPATSPSGTGPGGAAWPTGVPTAGNDPYVQTRQDFLNRQSGQSGLLQQALAGLQSGAGAMPPRVQYGAGGDLAAAQNAAFARAKDMAGATGRQAVNALHEETAGRGLSGSGIEAAMTATRAISPAASALSNVESAQMGEGYQAAQHAADVGYQGGVTQRGQEITNQQNRQQQALQLIMSALQGGLY